MKYINIVNPDVVQPLYNVYDIEYETSGLKDHIAKNNLCLLYTSPSPRDRQKSRMPSSA